MPWLPEFVSTTLDDQFLKGKTSTNLFSEQVFGIETLQAGDTWLLSHHLLPLEPASAPRGSLNSWGGWQKQNMSHMGAFDRVIWNIILCMCSQQFQIMYLGCLTLHPYSLCCHVSPKTQNELLRLSDAVSQSIILREAAGGADDLLRSRLSLWIYARKHMR